MRMKKPLGYKSYSSTRKECNSYGKTGILQKKCRRKFSNNNTCNSRINRRENSHADRGQFSEGAVFASSFIGIVASWKSVVIDGTEVIGHWC